MAGDCDRLLISDAVTCEAASTDAPLWEVAAADQVLSESVGSDAVLWDVTATDETC